MKQPRRRRFLGLFAFLGLSALLVTGCIGDGSRGWASPVPDDDVLYVSTGAGRLDALDSEGRQLWRFPLLWEIPERDARNLRGIYGDPVLTADGSTIFLGDYNGHLYAFRPGDIDFDADARPRAASLRLNGPVIGGIALDEEDDTLYVTSENRVFTVRASHMINRIDNRDAPVARTLLLETQGEIWAKPVIADDVVLVASLDGNLYAVDKETGQERWRYHAGPGLVVTPVVEGDRVLVAGFDSSVTAVTLETGMPEWSYRAANWVWSRPVIANGLAYFGDFDGILHAVNLETGEVQWSEALGRGIIRAGPAVVDGVIVLGTDEGWLIAIDLDTRQRVWQRDIGTALRADFVVKDGQVLLAPDRCVTPEGDDVRTYYRSVDPRDGNLHPALGVC